MFFIGRYKNDEEFPLFVCKLDALAFLPVNDVVVGFQLLQNSAPDGTDELVAYKDVNYVNGTFRNIQQPGDMQQVIRRIPPRFPPESWNVHNQAINGDPKTNNLVEGWNHRFKKLLGHIHPTIWRAIEYVQLEREVSVTKIRRHAVGEEPYHYVKRENQATQRRLKNLCIRYRDGGINMNDFLGGIARNIQHGQG